MRLIADNLTNFNKNLITFFKPKEENNHVPFFQSETLIWRQLERRRRSWRDIGHRRKNFVVSIIFYLHKIIPFRFFF